MQGDFGLEFFSTYFIRCPTCGTLISPLKDMYLNLIESDLPREDALDQVGLTNPCCRAKMLVPVQWPRIRIDDKKVFGVEEPKITLPKVEETAKKLATQLLQGFVAPEAPPLVANSARAKRHYSEGDSELELPKSFGVPSTSSKIYYQDTSMGPIAKVAQTIFLT